MTVKELFEFAKKYNLEDAELEFNFSKLFNSSLVIIKLLLT